MERRVGSSPAAPGLIVGVGLVAIAAYVGCLLYLMSAGTYDTWGGLLVAPVLIAVSVPVLVRQAARERDGTLFRLLVFALLLKLLASLARLYVAFDLYGGVADAADYHSWGVKLSELFRSGVFHTDLGSFGGTNFIRLLTGVIYTVVGPSKVAGYLVFSWLGFWGLFLFYRAFTIAVPQGRARSYARILFFLPSLLFWPSGIGKEAWMMLSLGVVAFAAARAFNKVTLQSVALLLLGLGMTVSVRPHIAGLLGVALAGGFVVRRPRRELGPLAPFAKLLTLAAVAVLAFALVSNATRFLQEAGIGTGGGLRSTFADIGYRTGQGGSAFVPSVLDSPMRAPIAVVTVLFRPLVGEAHNFQAGLAALEGTFLLALTLLRLPWILQAVRTLRRQPYAAFAALYSGLFIIAFSSFANFGLLARERVQLYPLYLVLLSVPSLEWRRRRAATGRDAGVPAEEPS